MISPAAFKPQVDGADVLIAIEVSQTTLGYDRGLKAKLYARHGVAEYWVIDVSRRRTIVHRGPRPDGTWSNVETWDEGIALAHPAVPGFSLRLAGV